MGEIEIVRRLGTLRGTFTRRSVVHETKRGEQRLGGCGEAVHRQEAVERVSQLLPDVVVLDFAMP